MPAIRNTPLTARRARYASLGYWRPGSPEHLEAAREFFCALLTQQIRDAVSKSPKFSECQIKDLVAALQSAEVAPDPIEAP